ncbi:MAG: hypothetical protein PHY39_03175 [Endomicrobiaceae bacterium]|nr:hypothetical protein [Endomicrobiaceae bacterium]
MNSHIESKENVEMFLNNLQIILKDNNFNIVKNFTMNNTSPKNTQTLLDLDYNTEDIKDKLELLKVSDYYETVPDNKYPDKPDFYVFFILIKKREIYIKVSIRGYNNHVLCMSFHYAEFSHKALPYMN